MVTDDPYSKAEKGEVEIGRSFTQTIVISDQFYTKTFTAEGREFFIFSQIGDYIKGFLVYGSTDNSHINRAKSYKMHLSEGRQHGREMNVEGEEIIEFFANRQLQRIIHAHELVNRLIRIVFIGRKKSSYTTHSAKVYRVFHDKGFIKESEVVCNDKPKRRTSKNRIHKSTSVAAGR